MSLVPRCDVEVRQMSEHEGLTLWLREGCTVASGQVVEFQAELCSWDSKQVR